MLLHSAQQIKNKIFGSLAERYVPRGPKGMDPALEEVQRSLLKVHENFKR